MDSYRLNDPFFPCKTDSFFDFSKPKPIDPVLPKYEPPKLNLNLYDPKPIEPFLPKYQLPERNFAQERQDWIVKYGCDHLAGPGCNPKAFPGSPQPYNPMAANPFPPPANQYPPPANPFPSI